MKDKEISEHAQKMKDTFPDYPCAKCGCDDNGMCSNSPKCTSYQIWLKLTWKKIRERLKKYDE